LSDALTIAGNEMRMLFPSWRWNLAVVLVFVCALAGTYQAYIAIGDQIESFGKGEGPQPTSLAAFASAIWIAANAGLPILAIISGYDSITRERRTGGMQILLARSTSKVSIIAGKFLGGFASASLIALSTVLVASGLVFALVGPFSSQELLRIMSFSAVLILYVSVWVAISILISTVANSGGSSALASLLLLFVMGGWSITSASLSSVLAPLPPFWAGGGTWYEALSTLKARVDEYVNWFSPSAVFAAGGGALLNPAIDIPPFVAQTRPPVFPVDVLETLRINWPCISTMTAMLTIMLISSYVILRTRGNELERRL
jgi:ABC-type transport system involved in multi-copper enzyme maturation permease subunit